MQMAACLTGQQSINALVNSIYHQLSRGDPKPPTPIAPRLPSTPDTPKGTPTRKPLPSPFAGIRATSLVIDFIVHGWGETIPSQSEKEVLQKARLVVRRFTDFISDKSILTSAVKPSSPTYEVWYAQLHSVVLSAEKRMIEYIDRVAPGKRKRQREYLMVTSVNKDLACLSNRDDYPH